MIRWLIQTTADHPALSSGQPPPNLLTPTEMAQYHAYISPIRRRDWLLGRWTTKELAQTEVAATQGFSPPLDAISIAYDANGAPYLTSSHPALKPQGHSQQLPFALSISHSHGYAFCALCKNHTGHIRLGADIEMIQARTPAFAQEFFTPAEQANIQAAPPHLYDQLVTATWSAKEALLKATHIGLRTEPTSVECIIAPNTPRHWTPLRASITPALRAQVAPFAPLRVWWRVIDNKLRPGTHFVLTIAASGITL